MKIEELVHFLEILLRKRFHDVPEKQKIDGSSSRKLNFACPICGDSDKKLSKKRGNLYLDSNAYKCFNDGCMAYMPLSDFIAKMCNLHGIMLPSFVLDVEYKPVKVNNNQNQLIRFLTSDTSELITVTDVINRFSLKRLDSVDEGCEAFKYIKGRNLHLIEDYGDFLYCDSSDSRIFIFNFDRRSGRMLGFAMRSLDPNVNQKYIIKSYTDLRTIFMQRGLGKDLIDDANFLNNYFNILNLDFSKPISMTEGQFDSLFIDNCMATTGASKARSILSDLGAKGQVRIIFDRDKAGKTQMMSFIQQGYSVFLWNKVIDSLKKKYPDFDDILEIRNHIKDINDLFSFISARESGYSQATFNRWINSYFSETVFDMAYL